MMTVASVALVIGKVPDELGGVTYKPPPLPGAVPSFLKTTPAYQTAVLKQKFLSNPFKSRLSPQTRLLRPLVRQHKPIRVLVRSKEFSNPPPGTFVNGQGSSPLFQSFSTLLKPQMPQPTTRRTRSGQVAEANEDHYSSKDQLL